MRWVVDLITGLETLNAVGNDSIPGLETLNAFFSPDLRLIMQYVECLIPGLALNAVGLRFDPRTENLNAVLRGFDHRTRDFACCRS